MTAAATPAQQRVLVFGGTGTIGRATVTELLGRGHEVVCFGRPRADRAANLSQQQPDGPLAAAELRFGDVIDPVSLAEHGFCQEPFDAILSCMASRTGTAQDAWAIDHQAHMNLLPLARAAGVKHLVLLSAICVQKPRLAFQHAKLAFEQALMDSGLIYSVVRSTAYFKSLSGQIARLQQGKPFLVFGDGTLTACKPISDADLATYLADCLDDTTRHNRILPIGGPGPAITPLQQGEHLFALLQREPQFKHVPVGLLGGAAALLSGLGKVLPPLAAKAELARIGQYYATESMLLFNPETGRYDADATPETGRDTLFEYYRRVIDGRATVERGDHAVF